MSFRFAIVMLLVALSAAPAQADQAADNLRRLNLIGRWAVDCDNQSRSGISFQVDPDGAAIYGNVDGLHQVTSVVRGEDRSIVLTIKFFKPVEAIRVNAIRMIDDNTYVPTMNRNERFEYSVRDGILLKTGERLPQLHRCGQ